MNTAFGAIAISLLLSAAKVRKGSGALTSGKVNNLKRIQYEIVFNVDQKLNGSDHLNLLTEFLVQHLNWCELGIKMGLGSLGMNLIEDYVKAKLNADEIFSTDKTVGIVVTIEFFEKPECQLFSDFAYQGVFLTHPDEPIRYFDNELIDDINMEMFLNSLNIVEAFNKKQNEHGLTISLRQISVVPKHSVTVLILNDDPVEYEDILGEI